jgi:hypothetical protein
MLAKFLEETHSFMVIPHAFFFSNAWPNARETKTLAKIVANVW